MRRCSVFLALVALPAFAADTTALFEQRQRELARVPFFCAVGRAPILSSLDALTVQPGPACKFSGPLDTKRDPRLLEPPFLNPLLRIEGLASMLREEGVAIGSDGRFLLGAESLRVQELEDVKLKDPLFHFRGHPAEWGSRFLSISAVRAEGIAAFVALARKHSEASWENPYFAEEEATLPTLLKPDRRHLPLPLLSKCAGLGPLPRLLAVGGLHRGEDSRWTQELVEKTAFAFAALELNGNKQAAMDAFLAAGSTAEEDVALARITSNFHRDVVGPYQALLRSLKARRVPVILIDYDEPYFNFPYTSTAFHGLPIAMRNRLWASRLPARWEGTGLLFAGRDHFVDLPGADFQDFALARFPGLSMALVNLGESCR